MRKAAREAAAAEAARVAAEEAAAAEEARVVAEAAAAIEAATKEFVLMVRGQLLRPLSCHPPPLGKVHS